jgi:hypothetical protein
MASILRLYMRRVKLFAVVPCSRPGILDPDALAGSVTRTAMKRALLLT